MIDITASTLPKDSLIIGKGTSLLRRLVAFLGHSILLLISSSSAIAIMFIFYFIIKDAVPFFQLEGFLEFFTSTQWYPSAEDAEFGALSIFVGTGLVTLGAVLVATPLGVAAAVCLSDVLPFSVRQVIKPVIEILAAIPSVAFGFFALVVLAPLLQEHGGVILSATAWFIGAPMAALAIVVISDLLTTHLPNPFRKRARTTVIVVLGALAINGLYLLGTQLNTIVILSGTNALNVSLILGIMALPTVVSVSEDALSSVSRELREGSYAMGATRAETLVKVVIPAAGSGILAAILLGIMRAIGETMVVWMASGNAARIPSPWYSLLQPIRTLTATIAGDMGEADHVTGSSRYHVLFAMGFCLLLFSFLCNLGSQWAVKRSKRRNA